MGYENSGRRPQPTALRVLRGNPSKTKLNKREPKPPAGKVTRPDGLSAGAVAVWDELAPICLAMGTLTTADVRPFATLCELQATLLVASRDKDDPEMQAAAQKLERDTAVTVRQYYTEFGLTPVSRARLSVPEKPGEQASKWA